MGCSVLTVVATLCLVAHKLSAGSDGRRRVSQLAAAEGDDTISFWNVPSTAPVGVVPVTPRHLVYKGDDQDDITTPADEILTTAPEDSFTTSQDSVLTTAQGNIAATGEGVIDLVMTPILEEGRVPTRGCQLVVCPCPLPTPHDCRRFLSGLYIDGKDNQLTDTKIRLTSLRVVVHNVTCEKEDHRPMNFSEGQFFLRRRGDIVLRNAEYLKGLRINDYCADPRTDNYGNVTWVIKACIPPPSVPTCCPLGEALRGGKCESASTPDKLRPPMIAEINNTPISWPVIKNHHNPLTCPSDPLISIPLLPDESYLLAVPDGPTHVWIPSDGHVIRKYTYDPDLCVDGHMDASGSVRYTVNICYTYPNVLHQQVCDGHICVRKCCQDDEEMSLLLRRCVPSDGTTYTPPDHYKTVNGLPLCQGKRIVNESTVDSRGHLHFNGEAFTAKEYCIDKFNNCSGEVSVMAYVCRKASSAWPKTRQTALPVCQIISLLFLTLTVGCYCLVPELLQGGGWYQLFHVFSLMLGYASMLAHDLSGSHWATSTCLAMGIVLQFGFLAAFFWLSVLCFEVWRKIRSLNNYRAASTVPIWAYLLYAFGVPAAIGVLTVCMQFYAPDGVPGVVKPNLAKSRCFFEGNLSHFLYFYGPIAFLFLCNTVFISHTFWTYRKIEQNASVLKRNSAENTATVKATEQTHQKRDYVSDFKQQFSLFVLSSSCWVAEVLSWMIPPPELWSVTDMLNSLQGLFIFVIFIANKTKRKHLKTKFPLLFKMAQRLRGAARRCCCRCNEVICLAPVRSCTSYISRLLSSSSVVILSTFSTSLQFEGSSVSVSRSDNENVKKQSEPQCGVITLSYATLHGGDAVSPPLNE